MKKLLCLLTLTALAALPCSAAPLLYDGFDYTAGQFLAPLNDTSGSPNPGQLNVAYGVNWRYAGGGAAANNAPSVANNGLTYAGLMPGVGNSAAYDTTQLGSARIQVTPSAISSGTVFWSGLLRVNIIGTLTTGVNGMLLGGFNNTAGAGTLPTVYGSVLRIRTDSSDPNVYHIGTAMNGGTGTGNVQFDNATSYLAGQTVFVVGSYEFVTGSNNDIARMWINPGVGTFGAGSAPTETLISAPGGTVADAFASLISFNLRNVNTVGTPGVQFDELRVGTSWADVTPVPEPTSLVLGSLAALALWLGRRKH